MSRMFRLLLCKRFPHNFTDYCAAKLCGKWERGKDKRIYFAVPFIRTRVRSPVAVVISIALAKLPRYSFL